MGEPVTLAIVGGVLGAVGQVSSGVAARDQARFQSQIARNNAIIAERKAEDARARGKVEGRRQQIRTAQLIADQRTAAAASGQVVDTGTALEATVDTAGFGKLDELIIRRNAEREALGFEGRAANLRAEADASRAAGSQAFTSGLLAGTGTILATAPLIQKKFGTPKFNSGSQFNARSVFGPGPHR